ncbi:MAG: MBL fold metallo-hydrolase, partial [Lachnospiraceae bacterium]|nr:MBL fold metallo-hydrolase [Lachnospiraceae bacterium]
MKTEELLPDIYRIPVSMLDNPLRELNSYLIKGENGNLLIDTGFHNEICKRDLLGGLREIGVKPEETDIFLTHLHGDHSGLASDIVGADKKIYISEPDRSWIEDPMVIDQKWEGYIRRLAEGGMSESLLRDLREMDESAGYSPSVGCRNYVSVYDGDTISVGRYHLQCILTPGHTPGHMCLWDEEHGLMFTGDHVLFDITPNITNWEGLDDALASYLSSLESIKQYPVKTALPGHRKSGDYQARIDKIIRHHQARLSETLRIVSSCPGLNATEIAARSKWNIRSKDWESFPDSQKQFAVGESIAHLDYLYN